MSSSKIEDYLLTLQKSKLIPRDRLSSALEEFKHLYNLRSRSEVTVEKLAEHFIQQKLLTEWQHKKLLNGHHKGFYLGKYRLLSHLGSGGMSNVYLAEHQHMRRRAAIKVLPRSLSDNQAYLKRFYLEARAIAALDHPNIVHAYGFDNEGTTHYMAMQFVEGSDLQHKVMNEGPLDPVTAAKYIRQAANGLAHAHERGLIHRDMKPANLMVDKEQTVKLMDLGLAQMSFHESGLTTEQKGSVLGTADYLAPEQAIDSHNVDHRADLYSLGATFYFLLTGKPPFPTGTIAQRLMKHQVEEPKSINEFRSDVPEDLQEIIRVLMAKKREQRYESAEEVVDILGAWLSERGEDDEVLTSSGPKSTARRQGSAVQVATPPEISWEAEEEREPFEPDSDTGALVLSEVFESSSGHRVAHPVSATYRRPQKQSSVIYASVAGVLLLIVGLGYMTLVGESGEDSSRDPTILVLRLPEEGREEVSVRINDQVQPVSTSSGTVQLKLSPGKYTVSVHREGFVPFEDHVIISKDKAVPPLKVTWYLNQDSLDQKFRQNDFEELATRVKSIQAMGNTPQRLRDQRDLLRDLTAFQKRWPATAEASEVEQLMKLLHGGTVSWDQLSASSLPTELQDQTEFGPLVQIYEPETSYTQGERVMRACYHPQGSQVVTFPAGKPPQLWVDGKFRQDLALPTDREIQFPIACGFVAGGSQLSALVAEQVGVQTKVSIFVWNFPSAEIHGVCELQPDQFRPGPLGFGMPVPDANSFLLFPADGSIIQWDTQKLESGDLPIQPISGTLISGAVSPDGQKVVRVVQSPTDKSKSTIYFDDLTEKVSKSLDIDILAQKSVFDFQGNLYLYDSLGGHLHRWDTTAAKIERVGPLFQGSAAQKPVNQLLISRDNSAIVALGQGSATWWKLPKGQLQTSLLLNYRSYFGVDLHPNGEELLLCPQNVSRVLCLKPTFEANEGHIYPVASMKFTLDGASLLTAAYDGRLCQWQATAKEPTTVGLGPAKLNTPTLPTAFRADGGFLATFQQGNLFFQETPTLRVEGRLPLNNVSNVTPNGVELHPTLPEFVYCFQQPIANKFALRSGKYTAPPRLSAPVTVEGQVDDLAFSEDGEKLACSVYEAKTRKGIVTLRDPRTCELRTKVLQSNSNIHFLCFDSAGTQLACCQNAGKVVVWSEETKSTIYTLDHPSENVLSVAFAPFSDQVVTQTTNGRRLNIVIWSISAENKPRKLKEFPLPDRHAGSASLASTALPGFRLAPLQISPEGRHLAAANVDGSICLYRLESAAKAIPTQTKVGTLSPATATRKSILAQTK